MHSAKFLRPYQFSRQTWCLDGERSGGESPPPTSRSSLCGHRRHSNPGTQFSSARAQLRMTCQAWAAVPDQGRAGALSDEGPRAQQGMGHGRRSREKTRARDQTPQKQIKEGGTTEGSPSFLPSPSQALLPLQIRLERTVDPTCRKIRRGRLQTAVSQGRRQDRGRETQAAQDGAEGCCHAQTAWLTQCPLVVQVKERH